MVSQRLLGTVDESAPLLRVRHEEVTRVEDSIWDGDEEEMDPRVGYKNNSYIFNAP